MAVNGAQICDLEQIDCQIFHTMVQYGDSTVYFSRIGDLHLKYPVKLRSPRRLEVERGNGERGRLAAGAYTRPLFGST